MLREQLEKMSGTVPVGSSWTIETYTGCWQGGRIFVHKATGDFVFVPCGESRPKDGRRLVFIGDGLLNVKGWIKFEPELTLTNPL